MPYFHIRLSNNQTEEFIVQAANRMAAEEAAYIAAGNDNKSSRTVIHTRADSSSSIDTCDADKTDWTEALKKKKAK
jgi:hypothetical protein